MKLFIKNIDDKKFKLMKTVGALALTTAIFMPSGIAEAIETENTEEVVTTEYTEKCNDFKATALLTFLAVSGAATYAGVKKLRR